MVKRRISVENRQSGYYEVLKLTIVEYSVGSRVLKKENETLRALTVPRDLRRRPPDLNTVSSTGSSTRSVYLRDAQGGSARSRHEWVTAFLSEKLDYRKSIACL